MKKIFLLLVVIINFVSCKMSQNKNSFNTKIVSNGNIEVFSKENYDSLRYVDKRTVSADTFNYLPQNYEILIPKDWRKINIISNRVFLNYDKNQIIAIDGGFLNEEKKISNWEILDVKNSVKESFLSSYFKEIGIKQTQIFTDENNFKTKILTDNKIKILLFKIEDEKFEEFLSTLKNLNYLD